MVSNLSFTLLSSKRKGSLDETLNSYTHFMDEENQSYDDSMDVLCVVIIKNLQKLYT